MATPLSPAKLQLAEHARNAWDVLVTPTTTRKELEDAAYWAHVSTRLKPRDRIEVLAEDGGFFAEFLVIESGRLFARVLTLRWVDFEKMTATPDMPIPEGYAVAHRGVVAKWSVMRGTDVMKEGLSSRSAAEGWLREHVQSVAA